APMMSGPSVAASDHSRSYTGPPDLHAPQPTTSGRTSTFPHLHQKRSKTGHLSLRRRLGMKSPSYQSQPKSHRDIGKIPRIQRPRYSDCFRTDDIGYLDAESLLYLTDQKRT